MKTGKRHKNTFLKFFKKDGVNVSIYKCPFAPDSIPIQTKSLKNVKQSSGQVVFQFKEPHNITQGDLIQQQGSRDLWEVTETEDIVSGTTFVMFEVKVRKTLKSLGESNNDNIESAPERRRNVYVIYGRNELAKQAMFSFLRSIGLHPIEKSHARGLTGKSNPYVGDIIKSAFSHAQAIVVLFSGDDESKLKAEFAIESGLSEESVLKPQPRANVLFEAGMAFATHYQRTVLVQFGEIRSFSNIEGKDIIRMSNSLSCRQELAARLRDAGCMIDTSGTDWHKEGDFDHVSLIDVQKDIPSNNMAKEIKGIDSLAHMNLTTQGGSKSGSNKSYKFIVENIGYGIAINPTFIFGSLEIPLRETCLAPRKFVEFSFSVEIEQFELLETNTVRIAFSQNGVRYSDVYQFELEAHYSMRVFYLEKVIEQEDFA